MNMLWLKIKALFDKSVKKEMNSWRIVAASDGSVPIPTPHLETMLSTYDQVFLFIENPYGMRKIVGFSYIHNKEILNAKECFEFSELTSAFLEGVGYSHLNKIVGKRNRSANISLFEYKSILFRGWEYHD